MGHNRFLCWWTLRRNLSDCTALICLVWQIKPLNKWSFSQTTLWKCRPKRVPKQVRMLVMCFWRSPSFECVSWTVKSAPGGQAAWAAQTTMLKGLNNNRVKQLCYNLKNKQIKFHFFKCLVIAQRTNLPREFKILLYFVSSDWFSNCCVFLIFNIGYFWVFLVFYITC